MRSMNVTYPRRRRAGFDLIPWLAGLAVLALVALIVVRKATAFVGIELPRHAIRYIGLAIWWIYWGSVFFFGLLVIRRWRNTYFRWRRMPALRPASSFNQAVTLGSGWPTARSKHFRPEAPL